MRRIIGFLVILTLSLLVTPFAREAQPRGERPAHRMARIWLPPSDADCPALEPSGKGCANWAGWRARTSPSSSDRRRGTPTGFPSCAAELVQLQVDVIVAGMRSRGPAAQQATSTIPIVMAVVAIRSGPGIVANLARPGGNITG